jgi:hypothetical protein
LSSPQGLGLSILILVLPNPSSCTNEPSVLQAHILEIARKSHRSRMRHSCWLCRQNEYPRTRPGAPEIAPEIGQKRLRSSLQIRQKRPRERDDPMLGKPTLGIPPVAGPPAGFIGESVNGMTPSPLCGPSAGAKYVVHRVDWTESWAGCPESYLRSESDPT